MAYIVLMSRAVTQLLTHSLKICRPIFKRSLKVKKLELFGACRWPFGDVACRLMHYLINVTAYVTVYTLVLVSVIRYTSSSVLGGLT